MEYMLYAILIIAGLIIGFILVVNKNKRNEDKPKKQIKQRH